jgi:hypothetical protein
MDTKETLGKMNGLVEKLPFKGMAEKIPAPAREKAPIINRAIPWANHIVCGLAGVLALALVLGLTLAGCTISKAYRSVETTAIAEQIKAANFYELKPGETVKELEIERSGSLQVDLGKYEDGTWYSAHKDKIVAIEALEKHEVRWPVPRITGIWRIQYVD